MGILKSSSLGAWGVYVRVEEMVSSEESPWMGLWKSGCTFQTVLTKDLPRSSWLWDIGTGPTKELNGATGPRISVHLCLKAEVRPPGFSGLDFPLCIVSHLTYFPGYPPNGSYFFFVEGGRKEGSGTLLRVWWQLCTLSRKMPTGLHIENSTPQIRGPR